MRPGLIGSATGPAPKGDRLSGSGPGASVARLRVCHGPAVLGGPGALAAVRARCKARIVLLAVAPVAGCATAPPPEQAGLCTAEQIEAFVDRVLST